jgi:two-component system, OmpR family, sensor histidine kinase SaeS
VIALALIVATVTAGLAVAVVLAVRMLPTVRLQLGALALCSVVLPLAAVLLSGWVMFHMGDDLKILAVSSAAACAAVTAGLLLGRSLGHRIDRLRTAAREFASGDLTVRTPVEGPAELADVALAFNEMASHLAALFDSRSELVAWASHDLRTPIASLKAMLEALEDGVAEPGEYLPSIHAQVRTLEMLVDDLFEVARIDAGALTLEVREVDVSSLVRSCVLSLRPEAETDGIRLDAACEGAAPARCAPEKVERVLRNIVANALRHTPRDGTVVVSVAAENAHVEVTVEDSGEGLTPEVRARMFDRFWRGDPARARNGGGSGLGLTIARGLIEAQGGELWARPGRAGGASVGFTLPSP